jgi:hypothetical protein
MFKIETLATTTALVVAATFALAFIGLTSASRPSDDIIVGDVDCSGDLNAFDALTVLRHDAGLQSSAPPGCPTLGGSSHPVSAAISDLALRLGVASVNIAVDEVRQAIWPNSCLGINRGTACLDVITEGYWVNLESQGTNYEYRARCSGPVIATDFLDPGAIVDLPPGNVTGACH